MKLLKEQLLQHLIGWTLFAILLLLAAYYFITAPVLLNMYSRMVARAYDSLCTVSLQDLLRGSSQDIELLDEVSRLADYTICDEQFELVLSSYNYGGNNHILTRIRKDPDSFILDPVPERETERFGSPISIKGKVEESGHTYYVYVFKNTSLLLEKIHFGMNVLVICFAILSVILVFFYWIHLNGHMQQFEKIRSQISILAKGDYLTRISAETFPSDVEGLAKDLNHIAETINYDKSALRNLEYLLTKKGKNNNKEDVSSTKLARNITHQLKTPLAIISSQVELCSMETDPQKRDYYYTSIMEEIDKMSMLITNILTEAKNDHNYVSIRLRRTNVSELFGDLVLKYESWLSSGDIRFSHNIEPDLYAMADPVQLEQAVHNYMMNAFSHTRKGKQICLTCVRDGEWLQIKVFNEGNGIPLKEMESIWEDSYQGEKSGNRQGTGLGLYIVKDIVIQHHGICGLNNLSNGVEFWIEIPLLRD